MSESSSPPRRPTWSDAIAGVTGGVLAIPQGIAFALIAGMPPEHGLYAMILPTIVAALLRDSPYLVTGATNTSALVIGSLLATLAVGEERALAVMLSIVLLVGVIQILVGVLHLGDIGRYISQAVLVGFTFGAASLIFVGQVPNVLGVAVDGPALLIEQLISIAAAAPNADTRTVAIGALTWLILYVCSRLSRAIPAAMIAIAASAGIVFALDWGSGPGALAMVGDIPAAFPALTFPALDLALARDVSGAAAALAILGMVETLSIGKAVSSQARIPFHANQELTAQGAGNVVGAFFGCLPSSASWTRSAINLQLGARTRYAGVIAGFTVLVTMLIAAPYARFAPVASLAAVIMWIALHMVDKTAARYVWRWSRADRGVMLLTYASTVVFPIQYAIYFGVLASLALLVRRAGRLRLVEMVASGPREFHEIELDEHTGSHPITLLQLEGDLFFGVVDALEEELERVAARGAQVIVIRLKRAHAIDATAAEALADFATRFAGRGGRLVLCGLRPDLHAQIARSHLGEVLGSENLIATEKQVYGSIRQAIESAKRELVAGGELGADAPPPIRLAAADASSVASWTI